MYLMWLCLSLGMCGKEILNKRSQLNCMCCIIGLNQIFCRGETTASTGVEFRGLDDNTASVVPFIISWLPWLPVPVAWMGSLWQCSLHPTYVTFCASQLLVIQDSALHTVGYTPKLPATIWRKCQHEEGPSIPSSFTPRHNDNRLEPYQGLFPIVTYQGNHLFSRQET